MTDVDPSDFIDTYLVEVKPSVFTDTSLKEDNFDEDEHLVIFSRAKVDGELHVEFTTRQGLEKLLEKWNRDVDFIRRGALNIQGAHPDDESEADAYLLFKPL